MKFRLHALVVPAIVSVTLVPADGRAGSVLRYYEPAALCTSTLRDWAQASTELQKVKFLALQPVPRWEGGHLVYAKDNQGHDVGDPLPRLDDKGQPVMMLQTSASVEVLPSRDPNRPGYFIDRVPVHGNEQVLFVPFAGQNGDDPINISVRLASGETLLLDRLEGRSNRISVRPYEGDGDPLKSDTPTANLQHEVKPESGPKVDAEYSTQMDRELRLQVHNTAVRSENAAKVAQLLQGCLDRLKMANPQYCSQDAISSKQKPGGYSIGMLDRDVPGSSGPQRWYVKEKEKGIELIDPTEREFRVALACQEIETKLSDAQLLVAANSGLKCPDAGPALCASDAWKSANQNWNNYNTWPGTYGVGGKLKPGEVQPGTATDQQTESHGAVVAPPGH